MFSYTSPNINLHAVSSTIKLLTFSLRDYLKHKHELLTISFVLMLRLKQSAACLTFIKHLLLFSEQTKAFITAAPLFRAHTNRITAFFKLSAVLFLLSLCLSNGFQKFWKRKSRKKVRRQTRTHIGFFFILVRKNAFAFAVRYTGFRMGCHINVYLIQGHQHPCLQF